MLECLFVIECLLLTWNLLALPFIDLSSRPFPDPDYSPAFELFFRSFYFIGEGLPWKSLCC